MRVCSDGWWGRQRRRKAERKAERTTIREEKGIGFFTQTEVYLKFISRSVFISSVFARNLVDGDWLLVAWSNNLLTMCEKSEKSENVSPANTC